MAVDPTYPLYPIVCITCATLLLLLLATNIVRQSWSLGLLFLCFWLFWEVLTLGINAVLWSDNADVKLDVYCDIGEDRPILSLEHSTESYSYTFETICVDSQASMHPAHHSTPLQNCVITNDRSTQSQRGLVIYICLRLTLILL
jgi:hypothetical protein